VHSHDSTSAADHWRGPRLHRNLRHGQHGRALHAKLNAMHTGLPLEYPVPHMPDHKCCCQRRNRSQNICRDLCFVSCPLKSAQRCSHNPPLRGQCCIVMFCQEGSKPCTVLAGTGLQCILLQSRLDRPGAAPLCSRHALVHERHHWVCSNRQAQWRRYPRQAFAACPGRKSMRSSPHPRYLLLSCDMMLQARPRAAACSSWLN